MRNGFDINAAVDKPIKVGLILFGKLNFRRRNSGNLFGRLVFHTGFCWLRFGFT